MRTRTFHYQVGTHTFRIVTASGFDMMEALPSLSPFLTTAQTDSEILFELRVSDSEVTIGADFLEGSDDIRFDWEGASCAIRPMPDKPAYLVFITPRRDRQTFRMACDDHFKYCTAYLPADENVSKAGLRGSTESFVLNNYLMMLYAFNAARHHTLLMHASVISSNDKGYLFLGKSGTGKSTHTSLWLKHIPGCHLLNDDNPVVHVDNDSKQATVFGSPWSGKTPCYLNESVSIGAFVRLEQAPENEMERENAVRAFAALLPSCSCLKQNKEIYDGIVSTVTELATLVPVYHLKCLPDKEAAELCRERVESDGMAK